MSWFSFKNYNIIFLYLSFLLVSTSAVSQSRNFQTDIVVVGATPAGIMSAVAAARMGSKVVILEPTDHVGGIMTNGLTKFDIGNKKALISMEKVPLRKRPAKTDLRRSLM
jgi:ribulose 1,5-bisphosphate synthetase/thiazole synthase